MKYIVEIVKFKDKEVVKRINCTLERQAEKVERGVLINLNHKDFYTRIIEKNSD